MKPDRKITPYLFISVSLLMILIFTYFGVGYSFYASLTNLRLGYKAKFIGIDNYVKLFSDPVFYQSVINQLILLATDVFKFNFFPLLAAILLFFVKNMTAANIMKKLFVFPMLVPAVVVFLMFANIYSPTMGALNAILELVGLDNWQHDWLNDGSTALGAIIFIGFPFVSGLYFLIYHAGLNNIPGEIIEAAKIDGCRPVHLIRHILLPSIRVYIGTCIMLITIGSMQDYVKILVTTGGGPNGYGTYTPAVMLYKKAFDAGKLGYASSIGVVMFIVIMVLTVITFQITKTKDEN